MTCCEEFTYMYELIYLCTVEMTREETIIF